MYTPKCVSIHFEEARNKNSPLQCIVHFNNNSAVLVAQLFAEYDKIDPRVKPLVMAFRHLARVRTLVLAKLRLPFIKSFFGADIFISSEGL